MQREFIILCAGEATRFNGYRKQLLPVTKGTPLLIDTCFKFQRYGRVALVLRQGDDDTPRAFQEYGKFGFGGIAVWLQKSSCTLESLMKGVEAVEEYTKASQFTILLGDVFYDQDAVKAIGRLDAPHSSPLFFTDTADFFAVTVTRRWFQCFRKVLLFVIDLYRWYGPEKYHFGKLWDSFLQYHLIEAGPHRFDKFKAQWIGESVFLLGGETQDFDKPEDYHNWLRGDNKNEVHKGLHVGRIFE